MHHKPFKIIITLFRHYVHQTRYKYIHTSQPQQPHVNNNYFYTPMIYLFICTPCCLCTMCTMCFYIYIYFIIYNVTYMLPSLLFIIVFIMSLTCFHVFSTTWLELLGSLATPTSRFLFTNVSR